MELDKKMADKLLLLAQDAAESAGKCLLSGFRTGSLLTGTFEDSRSAISTQYDKTSNEIIINKLLKGFMNNYIGDEVVVISEELSTPMISKRSEELVDYILDPLKSELSDRHGYCWVVDPLCGSIPFAKGVADFIVSIALLKDSEIILGVVYDPVHKEMFSAIKGYGAYLNGILIQPSKIENLSKAYVSIEHKIFRVVPGEDSKSLALNIMRIRVAATCGLELCYVACGRLDGFIKLNQPLYDYSAGVLILLESLKGINGLTSLNGKSAVTASVSLNKKLSFVASNGYLHSELIKFTEKWEHFSTM
jgi:fructose-1,6-bisphosphatase/inositol monophosphatase family enzyme